MNEKEATELLNKTFNYEFDLKRFTNFLNELFNGFYFQDKSIGVNKEYAQQIISIKKIGNFKQKDKSMEILVVRLKKGTSLDRARTMQRNIVAKILKNFNVDSALVAFTSEDSLDWRFSFIKMDYNLTEGGKVSEELTPAKRYSFLVGPNEPNYTCRKQFLELIKMEVKKPSIDEIENAFSIENVTKEFFERYKDLFIELTESLQKLLDKNTTVKKEFELRDIIIEEFCKKTLGQIVFLYFLQKKGWLGVKKDEKGEFNEWGTGPKDFMKKLFGGEIIKYNNFFNDVLEPLFYDTLARQRDNNYCDKLKCKIPFLNGGLFEPINNYDWTKTEILFENDIFKRVFDTFDKFNFTIKEDEPLEKEVAVDPEMLGKVFENLLGVKDRKSKGAFYTPREIVHYMCQQGLINYLETNTKIPREDIEKFIQLGDLSLDYLKRAELGKEINKEFILPKSIQKEAKILNELLIKIKICDPAVGSGAFPVGMMNEIVKARHILNYLLKDNKKTDYDLKKETIENCLYGVDIMPSAVDICKLRFWLSLIVDEDSIDNIKPLPNLDNKIMCGNSLLDEFKGVKLFDENILLKENKGEKQITLIKKNSEYKLENLKKLQKEFFNEQIRERKNKLREEIDQIEWDLIKETLKEQDNEESMQKLEQYKKNKAKPFFLWKLYFAEVFQRENPGFDVVIANPPYVGEKEHTEVFREIKKDGLKEFYQGRMDLFYFFFHLGLNISRNSASVLFITTNYYPTAMAAKKLRYDFKERAIIKTIINFNELRIFESAKGQHNMITILQKDHDENIVAETCITRRKTTATPEILQNILARTDTETQYCRVTQRDIYDGKENYMRFYPGPANGLLTRVFYNCNLMPKYFNVYKGITTGMDELYVFDKIKFEEEKFTNEEKKYFKPWFKNSDIKKYFVKIRPDKYVLYLTKFDTELKKYIKLWAYLKENQKELQSRRDANLRGNFKKGYWWVLATPRLEIPFDKPKIVVPQRSRVNSFGYTENSWYGSGDIYFITEKDKSVSLKYILALLNSRLYYLWLYHRGKRKGEMLELYQKPLSEIPIKKISPEQQKPFIQLVEKILFITKDDDYLSNLDNQTKVNKLEEEIDQLVYKLYELTPEEIKIVEEFEKEK